MSAKSTTATDKAGKFSAEEMAAMKSRAKELKAEARAGQDKAEGLRVALEAIAALSEPDHTLAERLHAIITAAAPELAPKTWYGFPAYAKGGKIVCFFQNSQKFNTRYATLGFSDVANLDEGTMWPTSYALTTLTAADEARIAALVKKAAS